jgi:hypothetical protein
LAARTDPSEKSESNSEPNSNQSRAEKKGEGGEGGGDSPRVVGKKMFPQTHAPGPSSTASVLDLDAAASTHGHITARPSHPIVKQKKLEHSIDRLALILKPVKKVYVHVIDLA